VEGAPVTEHRARPTAQQAAPPPQNNPPGGSTQYSNQGLTDQNLQGQQTKQNQKSQGKGQGESKKNSSESKP